MMMGKVETDWDDILIQASIAAMQGIQESGKLGLVTDIVPKELAKMSVRIGKALVEELKKETEQYRKKDGTDD